MNSKGVSLYFIVFLLFLITALMASGIFVFGPMVTKYRITSTKNNFEGDVNSIISWSTANGRLPTSSDLTTYSILRSPKDAWGNQLAYFYDGTMSSISTGLCGVTSTAYHNSGVNIAFIVASGGYPYTNPGASGTLASSWTPVSGTIYRLVSLEEVKTKAGCYGPTGGRLRIINNELPQVCSGGASYAAAVFAAGGVPNTTTYYTWTVQNAPAWLSCNGSSSGTSCNSSLTGSYVTLSASGSASAATNLQFTVTDAGNNSITKTLPINISLSSSCPGQITTPPYNPGDPPPNNTAAVAFSNNVVSNNAGGSSTISVQNNVFTFGNNVNNGEACMWYPANFPLQGKTMRAYWTFCFTGIDTSANSTTYGDGYIFTLMQGNNPTTYCGTGTIYNTALNPFYNCSDAAASSYTGAAHLGEFISYCGLPGNNIAVEFDIYPNGSRNDPSGSYNHVAVVRSINTHAFGGSPACSGYCSGTCNGTCNGVTVNGACSGQCYGTCSGAGATCNTNALSLYGDNTHGTGGNPACDGTCNGSNNGTNAANSTGCLFDNICGQTHPVTWMEQEGCNSGYTNHNARVEVHTRCNSTCSSCDNTTSCGSYPNAYVKVWIDKGNSTLTSDAATAPDVSYCYALPSSMNQVKVGFTEGTGAAAQLGNIANFNALFAGYCSLPTISAASSLLKTTGTCSGDNATPSCASVPCICTTAGSPVAVQLTASGGTAPYTWNAWSAANITGVAASTLPSGLSWQTTGTCGSYTCSTTNPCICGTATTVGTYNTVLASVTDSCASDCANYNTVSQSYVINVGCSALSITTASPLPAGRLTQAYSTTIAENGGVSPFTWSAINLPSGLTINSSTGVISGTPTTGGLFSPVVTVQDSCPTQQTANTTYSLPIKYATYKIINNTGATIYPQIGGSCQTSNDISSGGTYSIAYNAAAITFYQNRGSGNSCLGNNISISGAAADAADVNYNGNVGINSSWQLVDQ